MKKGQQFFSHTKQGQTPNSPLSPVCVRTPVSGISRGQLVLSVPPRGSNLKVEKS